MIDELTSPIEPVGSRLLSTLLDVVTGEMVIVRIVVSAKRTLRNPRARIQLDRTMGHTNIAAPMLLLLMSLPSIACLYRYGILADGTPMVMLWARRFRGGRKPRVVRTLSRNF